MRPYLWRWSLLLAVSVLVVGCGLERGLADDYYHSNREWATGLHLFVPQWSAAGDRILLDEVSIDYPGGDRLELLKQTAYRPQLSPDGERAAYSVDPEGNRIWDFGDDYSIAIETSRVDGSNRRRLTHDDGLYLSPSWTPDGNRIAFVRGKGISTIDSDGSNLQRVIEYSAPFIQYRAGPVWSPDGSTLAFVLEEGVLVENLDPPRRGTRYVLFTVGSDGSNLSRVFSTTVQYGPTDIIGWPTWSPDGHRLAFVRYVDPALIDGRFEVIEPIDPPAKFTPYTVRRDSSDLLPAALGLPSGHWNNNNKFPFPIAEWSPDGSKIVFGLWTGTLHIAHIDGSEHWKVGPGNFASWSPDGSKIAAVERPRTIRSTSYLWTFNPDGRDRKILIRQTQDGDFFLGSGS